MKEIKSIDKKINIACSSDDNFMPLCGAMIYSMLKNSECPKNIHIYFIGSGISEDNREKLLELIEHFGSKIEFVTLIKPELKEYAKRDGHHPATYYRLFLDEIEKIDKVLYLDTDIIFLGRVEEIYNREMGGNTVIFAARDSVHDEKKKRNMGVVRKNSNYFNAGVLLIDLKKYRKKKEEILKNISRPQKIVNADQDCLNQVFCNEWEELPRSWNFLETYTKKIFRKDYSSEELGNINLIHFNGIKPMFFECNNPFKKYFWHYLKETPWKKLKTRDKNVKILIKKTIAYLYNNNITISKIRKRIR